MRVLAAIAAVAALAVTPAHANTIYVHCPGVQTGCGVPCRAAEVCVDPPPVCVPGQGCYDVNVDVCLWVSPDGGKVDVACVPCGDECGEYTVGPIHLEEH